MFARTGVQRDVCYSLVSFSLVRVFHSLRDIKSHRTISDLSITETLKAQRTHARRLKPTQLWQRRSLSLFPRVQHNRKRLWPFIYLSMYSHLSFRVPTGIINTYEILNWLWLFHLSQTADLHVFGIYKRCGIHIASDEWCSICAPNRNLFRCYTLPCVCKSSYSYETVCLSLCGDNNNVNFALSFQHPGLWSSSSKLEAHAREDTPHT